MNDCSMVKPCGRKVYTVVSNVGGTDEGADDDLTFGDMEDNCGFLGARPAIVRNAADDALLRAQLGVLSSLPAISFDDDHLMFWALGGQRESASVPFYWWDGTPVEPTSGGPWLDGYPTNDDEYNCINLATTAVNFDEGFYDSLCAGRIGWENGWCGYPAGPPGSGSYLDDDDHNYGLPFGVVCECADQCSASF